jgi:hypothetical protein
MPPGAQIVRPVDSKVILAVLSLAALTYAVLSSAVIPALPTIQRSQVTPARPASPGC